MAQLAIMAAVMAIQVGLSLLLQKRPKTPSQPELQPTSSIYGTPIRLTYGSMKQGGTVIWQSKRRKKKKTIGKGMGGGATMISYRQDFLISFGEADRDILAIFADSKGTPIYDARQKKVKQKYKAPIRIYKGGDDQPPDPLIEKDRGMGNAPAHRRLTTVMFENFPLDDFGGRIPSMSALVVQHETQTRVVEPWISGFNATPLHRDSLVSDRRPNYPYAYAVSSYRYPDNTWIYQIDRSSGAIVNQVQSAYPWGAHGTPDTDAQGYLYWAGTAPHTLTYSLTVLGKYSCDSLQQVATGHDALGATVYFVSGWTRVNQYADQVWTWEGADLSHSTLYCFARTTMELLYKADRTLFGALPGFAADANKLQDLDGDDQGNAWIMFSGPGHARLIKVDDTGNVFEVANLDATVPAATNIMWVQEDNSVLVGNGSTLVKVGLGSATVSATLTFHYNENKNSFHNGAADHAFWLASETLNSGVSVPTGALPYFPTFTQIDVTTLTVLRTEVFIEAAPLYPVLTKSHFTPVQALFDPQTHSILAEEESDYAIGIFHLLVSPDCVTLQSVVEDLSAQTTRLDVADEVNAAALADDYVCGYVREQRQPTRQDLENLTQGYAFYGVESDWIIKYRKRGVTPTIEIPEDDLASYAGGEQRPDFSLEEQLTPRYEIPKRVDVTYYDEDRNYEQGTQHWDVTARNVVSADKQTVTLPLVFNRDQAKDVARRLLFQTRAEAVPYKFSLQPKYLALDPGDERILVMNSGARLPIQFTKIELGQNYLLQCEAVSIEPAIYTPLLGKGTAGGGPQPIEIVVPGPTDLALLDTPMLRDIDNDPGPYIAVAPVDGNTHAWGGALILKSLDGGSSWNEVDVMTTPAIMGYALTALAAPRAWTTWDFLNSVNVKLEYEGDGLENLTPDQVLAFGNIGLLGNEFIQFLTPTQYGDPADKTWTLSGLLRGRKGTEWAIRSHAKGERFVLLSTDTIDRLSDSLTELNLSRLYVAPTSGTLVEDATPVTFTNTGRALKPYAPCYIQGARDGSNNLTITWLRRSRFGQTWNPWASPPLGEASEQYEIDILSGSTVLRTIAATSETASYSAANQTTDFGSPQSSIDINLYQLSDSVGRGFAAQATV